MEAVQRQSAHAFSQFELTNHLLQNLNKFNLSPVAKLVLLELSSHYNEAKNNNIVFPSTPHIAEVLGVGLTATKKAINDLIKEGIIIKSKRDKVRGNYNKYAFTKKVRYTTAEQSENESLKSTQSDLFMITNNKETKKEQTVVSFEKFSTKGAEEKPINKASSTTVLGFSKASDVSDLGIPQILKDKATKGEIKNLQGYWKSLRPAIKADYWLKQHELNKELAQKAAYVKEEMERKQAETLQREKEIANIKKPLDEQFTYQAACELIKKVGKLNKRFAFQGIAGDLVRTFNIDVDVLLG